jgi:hypothetical protein
MRKLLQDEFINIIDVCDRKKVSGINAGISPKYFPSFPETETIAVEISDPNSDSNSSDLSP